MSDTQQRLDAYKQAELRILSRGQSSRFDQRQIEQAQLADIRKAIRELEAKLAQEQGGTGTGVAGSLSFATVSFGGCGE